jgi:hypothetical protein
LLLPLIPSARTLCAALCLALGTGAALAAARAQSIDLTHAVVLAPADADGPQSAALHLLLDEAAWRTGTEWQMRTYSAHAAAQACSRCIVIGREDQLRAASFAPPRQPWPAVLRRPEAFRIDSLQGGSILRLAGSDDRGMLFAIGYLLRHIDFAPNRATLPAPLRIITAPRLSVRGHQLGYRFKNNTYDTWTPGRFEQYIRDLAVFGANTIELLPPKTDDAPSSPLFPLPAMETMIRVSGILKKYGLRCSVFYPAMAQNYADPATAASELQAWGKVFQQLPQLDEVFVPGGDPGHTDPAVLFPFLAQVAVVLHRWHPQAGIWVSAQGFNADQMRRFYALVAARPAWLAGVVVGPQSRDDLIAQRAHIPTQIPIRFYPDIAHTVRAQFPVPEWDVAYALTEGREVIDPRPLAETAIFRHYARSMNGFVTYSEGVNDDVNKFIWTALGWSPDSDPAKTLREYARYFLGSYGFRSQDFAQGILALERNWNGPLAANESVDATLGRFERMQKQASAVQSGNWRFQEALYRAYTDAYERGRLIAAKECEQRAIAALAAARQSGSIQAMQGAQNALAQDSAQAMSLQPMRAAIETLAGQLFHNIGIQLSVKKYGASAVGRGAALDTVDVSLNDHVWLDHEFARIRSLASEPVRLQAIAAIVNWADPGPGGFYDDLGNPSAEPHLVRGPGYPSDPAFLHTALDSFADRTPEHGWRFSAITHALTLYDSPLELHYTGLSRSARYRLRIDYAGESYSQPVALTANGGIMIHGPRRRSSNPEIDDFEVPAAATRSGTLNLRWTQPSGLGGGGRGLQVAEVWLIRESNSSGH